MKGVGYYVPLGSIQKYIIIQSLLVYLAFGGRVSLYDSMSLQGVILCTSKQVEIVTSKSCIHGCSMGSSENRI